MTFVNCKVYRWRIQDSSRSCCLLLAPFTLWHCVQHVAHRAQHATWQHLNYFYYVLENKMSSRTRCIHSYSERKTIWLGGSPAGTTGHVNVNPVKCATTSCFFVVFLSKEPVFCGVTNCVYAKHMQECSCNETGWNIQGSCRELKKKIQPKTKITCINLFAAGGEQNRGGEKL